MKEKLKELLQDRTALTILSVSIFVVVIFDQVTKHLVVSKLRLYESVEVIPDFFNITHVLNPGAAFGMLGGLESTVRQLIIFGVTVLALGVILYFLLYDYQRDRIAQAALGAILGGAIGNLLDRIQIGHVVDFLDVYVGSSHWPAFNVADSAICVGVVILLLRRPRAVITARSDVECEPASE
ncbi:MAG: signal peptidase II [Bdellovibrionales bacterium]|nr:signal peptidase II [Bdellovibrionales bacterium]